MTNDGMFQGGGRRDDSFGAGRVPDELIDAILDGEVDRADSRELFETLRSDPGAAGDLNATRRAIGQLKKPVATPDFAERVLGEVAKRRGGWLSHRDRRLVGFGRLAAGVAIVLTIGGLYMLERMKPGTLEVAEQPRAMAGLADSVSSQSAQLVMQTQQDVACLNGSALNIAQLLGAPAPVGDGGARVIFEWSVAEDGSSMLPPRMLVFSDQPISAASLAEHFSSITKQAGEAERTLREGRGFEISGLLPQRAERFIQSIGEMATSGWLAVSNTPQPVSRSGVSGITLHGVNAQGAGPVLITLPGFGPDGLDDASTPD